ncbi:uncharacterized protein si:ch211-221j21.3 [Hoplias malabaricus]|uniref:uncharacterized protein si:ch211-221j21.3 n=1 Tax=Hoplias malabaricus TaxID=27720 RepID=UPI003461BA1C
MSMDYVSALLHNKRGREGDHEAWDYQPKRVCNGLESCVQIECGALTASPMDTWETQQVSLLKDNNISQHASSKGLAAQNGGAQQCCPRCMAGESGHINHIMQRY